MMDIEANLQRGEALFVEGLFDEAETVFQEVLGLKPENYEALNNIGVIYHNRGHLEQAEQFFLKALDINGEYLDALSNLADLYQAANQNEKEADCLEIILPFHTNDYDMFNRLAVLYVEMGKNDRALPLLEASLSLVPNQENVKKMLQSVKAASYTPVNRNASGKNHTPAVSIGLPVYNGGKYLSEAIESILEQDFEDFELIISDNASTDNTPDICLAYQKSDSRIRLVRQERNMGIKVNFLNVLGLSCAPYFMFATHDDLHEKSFVSKCIKVLQADKSVSLVYPHTKLLNSNSEFLGIAKDYVKVDQNDPVERFRHLIWELGICNMMLGLFRTHLLKASATWGISIFGDTLLLSEVALSGKIIQIPEQLFIRRFTRNYNYKSPDDRNAQLMSETDPSLFEQGISLPHCKLTYAHLDVINNSHLGISQKEALIQETIKCFKARYGNHMKYEIDRAVNLISNGIYYWTWRNDKSEAASFTEITHLGYYRISNLLKTLQEALLIYPERSDLLECYIKCIEHCNLSGGSSCAMG